jgi:hypothetical protein
MVCKASITLMAIITIQVAKQIATAVIMVEVVVIITTMEVEARITKTSNLRRNNSNLKRESGRLLHHK